MASNLLISRVDAFGSLIDVIYPPLENASSEIFTNPDSVRHPLSQLTLLEDALESAYQALESAICEGDVSCRVTQGPINIVSQVFNHAFGRIHSAKLRWYFIEHHDSDYLDPLRISVWFLLRHLRGDDGDADIISLLDEYGDHIKAGGVPENFWDRTCPVCPGDPSTGDQSTLPPHFPLDANSLPCSHTFRTLALNPDRVRWAANPGRHDPLTAALQAYTDQTYAGRVERYMASHRASLGLVYAGDWPWEDLDPFDEPDCTVLRLSGEDDVVSLARHLAELVAGVDDLLERLHVARRLHITNGPLAATLDAASASLAPFVPILGRQLSAASFAAAAWINACHVVTQMRGWVENLRREILTTTDPTNLRSGSSAWDTATSTNANNRMSKSWVTLVGCDACRHSGNTTPEAGGMHTQPSVTLQWCNFTLGGAAETERVAAIIQETFDKMDGVNRKWKRQREGFWEWKRVYQDWRGSVQGPFWYE